MLYFDYLQSQIFWLLVTFCALFCYINYRLFPTIQNIFLKRNEELSKIDQNISIIQSKIDELHKNNNRSIEEAIEKNKKIVREVEMLEKQNFLNNKHHLDEKFHAFLDSIKENHYKNESIKNVKLDLYFENNLSNLLKMYEDKVKK